MLSSQILPFQDVRKDYRARIWNADFTYGRQGYGGEYTGDPIAYRCKVFPKTPQRVPAVDSSAAVDKKIWRTHYIAAHAPLTVSTNTTTGKQAFKFPAELQKSSSTYDNLGTRRCSRRIEIRQQSCTSCDFGSCEDLHGINPLLDQKKYNGKKVAEEHVLMRLHDAMLCRPRTWLNDAVIQDYSFFLNKVANRSEASVLFLSPVKQND
jgi:hypothetical protein